MTVIEEKELKKKPKSSNSFAQKELDKAEAQFDEFDKQIKDMTLDRMNKAPKQDVEPQTKMAQVDIEKSKEIYLKPKKTFGPGINPKTGEREKFNEKFRDEWNHAKEYVQFIAEHRECPGDTIQGIWTKPFPGTNCEEWDVPTNKPIWGPRYLAEQIKRASYHILKMEENQTAARDSMGHYYGKMAVDQTVQRLDAMPVSTRKSIFMGSF